MMRSILAIFQAVRHDGATSQDAGS